MVSEYKSAIANVPLWAYIFLKLGCVLSKQFTKYQVWHSIFALITASFVTMTTSALFESDDDTFIWDSC